MTILFRTISVCTCAFAALILSGCVTTGGVRIDNVPMYGQPNVQRPDELKRADEDFIKQASEGLGGREKASQAWASQGDKFFSEGNLDFAMRRYNQAWLLNPNNYRAYWGFGRVLLQQGKIGEAIQHLEKSKQLTDDQFQKAALLSDIGSAYSAQAESIQNNGGQDKARLFSLANQNFSESTALDASYGNSWRRWAMSLYEQGNYAGAWEKVKRARLQNARPFPPQFISALEQKMAEPK
ncbi:tetratricopeptide repeat protein [Betaproteobacteria bacterium SCN1]|jgi:tetratricopeptide (TPR) repeat protein|nr:tetratricopeptide repeat protein [Betaproteobacteria bacterium SCN1]